eukprot:3412121-Pyramimonas_sp.AAC.1
MAARAQVPIRRNAVAALKDTRFKTARVGNSIEAPAPSPSSFPPTPSLPTLLLSCFGRGASQKTTALLLLLLLFLILSCSSSPPPPPPSPLPPLPPSHPPPLPPPLLEPSVICIVFLTSALAHCAPSCHRRRASVPSGASFSGAGGFSRGVSEVMFGGLSGSCRGPPGPWGAASGAAWPLRGPCSGLGGLLDPVGSGA